MDTNQINRYRTKLENNTLISDPSPHQLLDLSGEYVLANFDLCPSPDDPDQRRVLEESIEILLAVYLKDRLKMFLIAYAKREARWAAVEIME